MQLTDSRFNLGQINLYEPCQVYFIEKQIIGHYINESEELKTPEVANSNRQAGRGRVQLQKYFNIDTELCGSFAIMLIENHF